MLGTASLAAFTVTSTAAEGVPAIECTVDYGSDYLVLMFAAAFWLRTCRRTIVGCRAYSNRRVIPSTSLTQL